MSWDILLHWMTHLGEGSWSSFRAAVAKIAGADADVDELSPRLRVALSDLGCADFFVDDSQRWRVLPPTLAGLPSPTQAAVLTGGCTPQVSAALRDASAAYGCQVVAQNGGSRPNILRLEGPPEAIAAAAAEAGIPYVPNFAATLCASIKPIALQIQAARVEAPPPELGTLLARSSLSRLG
jgi:hypothetical protein